MDDLLERFLRYVRVDTTADETSGTYPSSPGQLELGRMLASELQDIGAADVHVSEHGIVTATIPATGKGPAPTIAWFAHLDTSPEFTGRDVKPRVRRNYDGTPIPLEDGRVLDPAEFGDLASCTGKTVVTTDGTTLLGGDDKCGVAVIMQAAAELLADPSIPRGPVRVCFTCDEEIGHGVDHVDLARLDAAAGYTLDGGGHGGIDAETFSADLATVTVRGVNTHPSEAKGRMVNAVRILSELVSRLPWQALSPETTEGRDGFLHPYRIDGGVDEASVRVILRDFKTDRLSRQAALLRSIVAGLQAEHPRAEIRVDVTPQYRNMADGLARDPRALEYAKRAYKAAGIEPAVGAIRGGTDGSRLTEMGLPTPNLSCGEHNFHSPLEWTCVEEMQAAVRVLVELAKVWADG